MKKYLWVIMAFMLLFTGGSLFYWGLNHAVTLWIDDTPRQFITSALTVGQVLQQSQISISPQDRISPHPFSPAFLTSKISIQKARPVTFLDQDNRVLGSTLTSERIPGNLLFQITGKRLFPGDKILWNGQVLQTGAPLPSASEYILKYSPGVQVTLLDDDQKTVFYSSAPTLAQAVWEQNIKVSPEDVFSIPRNTPLREPITVTLHRAQPLTIQINSAAYTIVTAADQVGKALAEAGITLLNNDYAIPPETDPVPENRTIQVIQVTENVLLEQKIIPFESEMVASDQVDLDQRQVIEPGQYGVQVARTRIVYENGQEKNRQLESDWTVSLPVKQKVGMGTRVKVQTLDTPSGTIEYYRSVSVYATSYSPCNSGGSRCYPNTASGMPVQRGVIGVTRQWYNLFAGQRVYIPGYGIAVIADVGGGVPGKYWIDLGFSDNDYESWHSNVTMYFLTPAPANIPWYLP